MFVETPEGDKVCLECRKCIYIGINNTLTGLQYHTDDHANYSALSYGKRSVYKRDEHVRDFFANLQAVKVPRTAVDIFGFWKSELDKQGINKDNVTAFHVRRILRQRGWSRYYEYVPLILASINSTRPILIPDEVREVLIARCKAVEEVFWLCAPPTRKNFFNLNFVFYQLCPIIGADKYQHFFRLPRTKTVLVQNQLIWQKICAKLNWPFICIK